MPKRGVIEMKPVADDAWLTGGPKDLAGFLASYARDALERVGIRIIVAT